MSERQHKDRNIRFVRNRRIVDESRPLVRELTNSALCFFQCFDTDSWVA